MDSMDTTNSPEELTPEECWTLLRTAKVCRVAYSDRALPAIASMPFAVDGASIVLLSPEGTEPYAALRGAVIAFMAEQAGDSPQPTWSVTCIGRPSPIAPDPDGLRLLAFKPEMLQGRRLTNVPLTTPEAFTPAAAPAR